MVAMADCMTIGSEYVVRGEFRNAAGELDTPSTYSTEYRDPSGNTDTIAQGSMSLVSTGIVEATIGLDELGVWRGNVLGTIDGVDLVLPFVVCVKANGVD